MSTDTKPSDVELSEQGIRIVWNDGHLSVYPHRLLRLRCPCAHCVEEMTGVPVLDPEAVPLDVQAVDHMTVGNYAIEFLWSDTHYTGIYTYEFLRDLCACIECASRPNAQPT